MAHMRYRSQYRQWEVNALYNSPCPCVVRVDGLVNKTNTDDLYKEKQGSQESI